MTPLWDGLQDAQEIAEAGDTSLLTSLIRQMADRIDEEAKFMETVHGQVGSCLNLGMGQPAIWSKCMLQPSIIRTCYFQVLTVFCSPLQSQALAVRCQAIQKACEVQEKEWIRIEYGEFVLCA